MKVKIKPVVDPSEPQGVLKEWDFTRTVSRIYFLVSQLDR